MSPSGLRRLDSGAPAGEERLATRAHPLILEGLGGPEPSGVGGGRSRRDASPLGSQRAWAAERQRSKGRETGTEQSPQPSWGFTVPGGPELTRSSPIRPRPACPHLPATPPRDCVLCPVLSFRSQDGTFRVSVHTVIAGAAVGTAQKRRGFVGKGLCGLSRA